MEREKNSGFEWHKLSFHTSRSQQKSWLSQESLTQHSLALFFLVPPGFFRHFSRFLQFPIPLAKITVKQTRLRIGKLNAVLISNPRSNFRSASTLACTQPSRGITTRDLAITFVSIQIKDIFAKRFAMLCTADKAGICMKLWLLFSRAMYVPLRSPASRDVSGGR